MERISSPLSIECRGVQYREQGLTEPILQIDRAVLALVIVFRDGATEVCCPYLTRSSASTGPNKCSAGYDAQNLKRILPNCIYLKSERDTEEIPDLISKLQELMTEKGWNQKKLSEESGLDSAIISRIMTGKVRNPEPETLRKLEKALGKDLRTFLPASSDKLP